MADAETNELAEAMQKLSTLESRIQTVEIEKAERKGDAPSMDKGALLQYQAALLAKLKVIRDVLQSDDGDVVAIRKERDAAKEEAALLKKENAKLVYRVNHLVKALNEEEKKSEGVVGAATPASAASESAAPEKTEPAEASKPEKKKSFFDFF